MQQKPKPGDRIKFAAPTRFGAPVATRKVIGLDPLTSEPLVRFHGWADFRVRLSEVIEILPAT